MPAIAEERVRLRDGLSVGIRRAIPRDEPDLHAFLGGLCLEARRLRFFTAGVDLDSAAHWAAASGSDRLGLVAHDQGGALVAHAAFIQLDSKRAEVAVEVADRLHGDGLGTILIERLAEIAEARGVAQFVAEVLPENRAMLEVFCDGFDARVRLREGVDTVEFPTATWRVARERFGSAVVLPKAPRARSRNGAEGKALSGGSPQNRRRPHAPLNSVGSEHSAVDLYWLPLGAGGHLVRLNGHLFEAVAARAHRRPACDLYHSALEVRVARARFVIEQAPVRDDFGQQRGVVAEGPVGTRWAGRLRIFRYEIRRWRDGSIPDIDEAVGSPQRLTDDRACAQRLLDLVPQLPTPVWGRDDLRTGDMWNSNSVIAWLIARSGISTESIQPPVAGRAPGWRAGLAVARRQEADSRSGPSRQGDSNLSSQQRTTATHAGVVLGCRADLARGAS